MAQLTETLYKCANVHCKHEQVITDFATNRPLPVVCCVKCRAGFNLDLQEMIDKHIGMFPIKHVAIEQ